MRVKINEEANFDAVFGADCFRQNFPDLSTDVGVEVRALPVPFSDEKWYYIWDSKTNWMVDDTAFFTKADFEHLTIIRKRDSKGRFTK